MPTPSGSVRIFRFAGVNVYLHWTWALVAWLMLRYRYDTYSTPVWALLEYVALFGIVLLHEYGHALACRSVGGRAETILLWPLGGIAYVQAPPRPGAQLWSIAAGPLVNVVLLLPTWLAAYVFAWGAESDLREFLMSLALVNTGLLIFNLLPIYPLDGGQILRCLIWFFAGPANSLLIASLIGMTISAIALLVTLRFGEIWLALVSAYAAYQAWLGFSHARQWIRYQQWPRHAHAACPRCRARPLAGELWHCGNCRKPFDPIVTAGACPTCGSRFDELPCAECQTTSPLDDWYLTVPAAPGERA
jgi:Zn-dependent protease